MRSTMIRVVLEHLCAMGFFIYAAYAGSLPALVLGCTSLVIGNLSCLAVKLEKIDLQQQVHRSRSMGFMTSLASGKKEAPQ